jgi:hypothetical protein
MAGTQALGTSEIAAKVESETILIIDYRAIMSIIVTTG